MPVTKQQKQPALRVQDKFTIMKKDMCNSLIERDAEVDLVLTALLAGENVLLVGQPGTAKSMLLDAIMSWMGEGTKKFSVLFNKFSVPEEIFGPISVQGLKIDKYKRITTGKLPEADLFFGDELFKASTAILNNMLKILNEKVYDNGEGVLRKVPLILAVAASNEWPNDQDGGKELGALFDRFLLRKTVNVISTKKGRDRLLWTRDHTPSLSTSITVDEIKEAQREASKFLYSPDAKAGLIEIIEELHKEGIKPGDRRMFKAVKVVKAYAYLNGAMTEEFAEEVERDHLEILAHVLWDDPQEQAQKCGKIVAKIANPVRFRITELLMQIEDIKQKFGHNENEVIPKLKEILREFEKLPKKSNTTIELIEDGIEFIKEDIKYYMRKVIGE